MVFPEKIIGFFHDLIKKLTDEEKRRIILIGTAGFAVILVLSVILSTRGSGGKEPKGGPRILSPTIAIPAEELFLPDEPDFVPGVLPNREQRSSWSEEDAALYWQDPLRQGEEQWREKIEAAVDELLERVP